MLDFLFIKKPPQIMKWFHFFILLKMEHIVIS